MKILKGIPVSEGFANASCFLLHRPVLDYAKKDVDANTELKHLDDALALAEQQLTVVKDRAKLTLGEKEADLFEAHLLMLKDEMFLEAVCGMIAKGINAEYAVETVALEFAAQMESLDNEYFRERAADIKDVAYRICCCLEGKQVTDLSQMDHDAIIVAEDLTPSDTISLNAKFVKGIVTEKGGRTGHSAIIARSMGIPAVTGVTNLMRTVRPDTNVILYGKEGLVYVDPTEEALMAFKKEEKQASLLKERLSLLKSLPAETTDGCRIELAANISHPSEATLAKQQGAEGVGLYRTEFLYMQKENGFPDEEEQFECYRGVLENMQGERVVIRTLDIGGDKTLNYYHFEQETNPFLGVRAIRFCFAHEDVFRTQLRALLRASAYGKLAIMFPMIATVEEFRKAKTILSQEKQKLIDEGIEVSDAIEVGMMVEIPSVAILAEQFAKEADFFSIGTNDLIQYTLAADRMNPQLESLYQPMNPAVLKLISMVVQGAHSQGKWVGVCGEMAGNTVTGALLVGLGVDELSMSAASIPQLKNAIRTISMDRLKKSCEHILTLETEESIMSYIDEEWREDANHENG